MEDILIDYLETSITIHGIDHAIITVFEFEPSVYNNAVRNAVAAGFMKESDDFVCSFNLTEEGKDFMRIIML